MERRWGFSVGALFICLEAAVFRACLPSFCCRRASTAAIVASGDKKLLRLLLPPMDMALWGVECLPSLLAGL